MKPLSDRSRRLVPLFILLATLAAAPVYAACTNPAGNEADRFYNASYHTYQFCDGTNWIAYKSGAAWTSQANFNPTIPGGSGFFVLSGGTYQGNLGGRSGANATCLTDLTTNTGWRGYSTANSRGQLISSKVFAFLCDSSTCTNLNASTTYFFANAGNSSAGGASFTTDGSGDGPNDSADWGAANYFGGSYPYWTANTGNSTTAWGTTTNGSSALCNAGGVAWSGNGSYLGGQVGLSANTGSARWLADAYGCQSSINLICFVNP